ncbi:MAG: LytTR family DNA-binding domain-containing protein, partial [Bacteroidales bacterium]|nr:LytTR family DNA-binding domain-containing protein [Bacteroidales bacterium]
MNVLIIEDEVIAADNLEKQLLKTEPGIHILAKIDSIRDAVKWLSHNTADLIFLDIHLSDGQSFAIFEQIEVKIPIIFTTAYDQYTLKAFKLYSIDYLLKPIDIEELTRSIEKFKSFSGKNKQSELDIQSLLESFNPQKDFQKRFVVNIGQKIKMIKTEDIAWFNGSDQGTFLCTFSNSCYALDLSLDKLESKLDPEIFFRINRNYIVNIEAIDEMHTLTKSRIKVTLKPNPTDETLVSFNRM